MLNVDVAAPESVRILVVDDLVSQHVVLRTVLEEPGQDVVCVLSGREALKEVLRQDFAVILLDVNMPDMDGFETASLLRSYRRTAATPIIFVTAHVDDEEMARGYSLGAVDYISSPVVSEILRAKVRVFVQLYRMNLELISRAAEREELARAEALRASADQARQRADFLSHVSHQLTRSLDVETTLARVVDTAVPTLADVACVLLILENESVPRSVIRTRPASSHEVDQARQPPCVPLVPVKGFFDHAQQSLQLGEAVAFSGSTAEIFGSASAEPQRAPCVTETGEVTFYPLLNTAQHKAVLALGVGVRESRSELAAVITEFVSRASIGLENALLFSALREEDRRKDEFLAMLAHELRNPLAPISNAVGVMKSADWTDEKLLKWSCEIIGTQIDHMVHIVDDLLDVSRIARGTVSLRREPVPLSLVVERAIETSRPHFARRSQAFVLNAHADHVMVEGDIVRLTQVVANLLNNASKFTPVAGNIGLSTDFSDDQAIISVTDDGEGVDPKWLPRVFELFAQGDSSLDRAQGGLGIGLTLARHIVESHGGSITCSSDGRGKGAKFTVRLPARVEAKPLASAPGLVPLRAVRALRVLVVDDSMASAESVALFLEMQGYEVSCAYDGPSALVLARSFRPQVTILDIGLPGMTGYEVARRMREDTDMQGCLLIALSGYGQEGDRQNSKAAGMDHHLIKPADLDALTELIAKHALERGLAAADVRG
ncbi:ATP-binding response regulator [Paraburkholderia kirstenboschensis]|uniref:histidine kinase n=1 Tax=Paraburkholderia kirstenboschensis TaxID=1245436 RepID=A0ABZ0EBR6_9BURK|nr:response regulator [Paraburkholderia kirstenboschensis]WOD13949.1 response regulator [Paraburkholderia kirstenboschensis]